MATIKIDEVGVSVDDVLQVPMSMNLQNIGGIVKDLGGVNIGTEIVKAPDYEEGTWSPGFAFDGGSTDITYDYNTGRYIKIGKLVTVQAYIALSSKGTDTGNLTIYGLPFETLSDSTAYFSGAVGYTRDINGGAVRCWAGTSSQTIQVRNNEEVNLTDADCTDISSIMVTLTYRTN